MRLFVVFRFLFFSCPRVAGPHFFYKDLFIIYFMYMSTPLLSSDTPEEGIRPHCRWLWTTMWLLGIEPGISGRAVSNPNWWAISWAPLFKVLKLFNRSSNLPTRQSGKRRLIGNGWTGLEVASWGDSSLCCQDTSSPVQQQTPNMNQ